MRKTLTILGYVLLAGAVFAGTWTLAGRDGGDVDDLVEQATEDTGATPDSTTDSTNTTGTTAPTQTPTVITELAEPSNNPILVDRVSLYMAVNNVNPLAGARVISYMLITYSDVKRPGGKAGFISQASDGTEAKEAMHAAAWVAAELAEIPQMKADILKWVDKPSGATKEVVDAVLQYSTSDGYQQAEKATTPRFTGERAWKPAGGLYPNGLEPGWGAVKPFLGAAPCAVNAPDLAAIDADVESRRTAAENADAGDNAKTIEALSENRWFWLNSITVNPMLVMVGGYVTLSGEIPSNISEEEELRAVYATLGAYDALVATWKYKWMHGVAGPIDAFPIVSEGTEVDFRTASPSYPSWTGVAGGFLETYSETLQGREIALETAPDDMGFTTALVRALDDPLLHWSIDIAAGRELGACYARHAVKAYQQNG